MIGHKQDNVLQSESGSFFINDNGVAMRFEPSNNNPFIEEETEYEANYTFKTHKSIRTLIVPQGVKGFCSDFLRRTRVLELFKLPDGLLGIGNNSYGNANECNCIFANCILPEVVIPQSVQEIGILAFGHSHIDRLQLTESLHSPYGRQFKDSYIGTLILPKEWKDGVSLGEYNELRLNDLWLDNLQKYGYLRFPNTKIGNLEFY